MAGALKADRPGKAPRLRTAVALREGARIVLPAAESRHVKVLRLQAGDPLVVFAGDDDREWPAEIVAVGAGVELALGAPLAARRELDVAVTLAIGVPTNERMDFVVEKATELGAVAIVPLLSARSVLRLSGARAEARRAHWQAVASAACEQCGRNRVPEVLALASLSSFLGGAASLPSRRLVLSLADGATPLVDAVAGTASEIVVLSGPEGGLSAEEERGAIDAGFAAASLGPRVLRADTAPLAALATITAVAARRGGAG